jgi:hypothetical protein
MKRLTPIRVVILMFFVVILLTIISSLISCSSVKVTETQYDDWDTIYSDPFFEEIFIIELDTVKVPYKPRPVMIPPK